MHNEMHGLLVSKQAQIAHTLRNKDRLDGYVVLKVSRVLPALRRAEEKVIENSFGICDGCEEPIDERRLKAAPGAIHCVTCQSLHEKGKL